MESFGSSLVFVWLKLWHWFGYSLVRVQEFGLSNVLLAMPLVVRGWAASLRVIPHFGIETAQEDEYQKCNSVSLWSAFVGLGDEVSVWLVTTCQVFDSVTPPRHLQMIDSSAGRSSTQEWQGSGVRGRGSRGVGTHIGTWKDQQQYLSRAPQFLKQERGYIFVNFFSSFSFSFQRFWSCLCGKKVLLRYQYIMKKLFSLFSICCFFFFP